MREVRIEKNSKKTASKLEVYVHVPLIQFQEWCHCHNTFESLKSFIYSSWQIDGETMETVTDFIILVSKITADGDCSREIKRHLLLGRKAMTNLDSILKSRGITLPTKVCLVRAVVFPVVMYACESCTIKKAEHWRIDALELWCWRRLLRVPWTARRSNQSILKEISPEYSLEGLMLKLKLHYFGSLMGRTDLLERPWCWERLKAGREGNNRGWDGCMTSPTQWTWVWVSSLVMDREAWHAAVCGVTKSWTRLSDWMELIVYGASPVAQQERICLQCRRHGRHGFDPWVGKILWRRKWQSPPVFLPGKSQKQRSLAGYSPCGHKESDTTERTHTHTQTHTHKEFIIWE